MGVLKMIEEDEDVIAGVVPLKIINWDGVLQASRQGKIDLQNYTTAHNVTPLNDLQADKNKKIEVKSAGTGLLLISRKVFETLKPLVKTYKFSGTPCLNLNQGDPISNFWDLSIDDSGNKFGEDVNFCKLWRGTGGKVYTTFWPQATHIGNHVYR